MAIMSAVTVRHGRTQGLSPYNEIDDHTVDFLRGKYLKRLVIYSACYI